MRLFDQWQPCRFVPPAADSPDMDRTSRAPEADGGNKSRRWPLHFERRPRLGEDPERDDTALDAQKRGTEAFDGQDETLTFGGLLKSALSCAKSTRYITTKRSPRR
jgi:hypothetical protein